MKHEFFDLDKLIRVVEMVLLPGEHRTKGHAPVLERTGVGPASGAVKPGPPSCYRLIGALQHTDQRRILGHEQGLLLRQHPGLDAVRPGGCPKPFKNFLPIRRHRIPDIQHRPANAVILLRHT